MNIRFARFIIALTLIGIPVVSVSASTATAEPFTYSSVSVGYHAACTISTQGTALCWGWNYQRNLATANTETAVSVPSRVTLPNGEKFASIDLGQGFTTCGISTTGRAYCWGEHHIGSYFTPTSTTPVLVDFPDDVRVTAISNGGSTACALSTTQDLYCWGDVLDTGTGETEPTRIPLKLTFPDNGHVVSFDNGPSNTCAVTNKGNGYCWGTNDDGELGLGYSSRTSAVIPSAVTIPGKTIASFSVGLNRVCALTTTSEGFCWGDNYNGSFGDNTYTDSAHPQQMAVPNNEALSTLTTSWYHTCVTTASNKTWCFGRGDFGELGTGTTLGGKTWRTPIFPSGVTVTSISAGLAGTCAVDNTSRTWCWGFGNWGIAGDGTLVTRLSPVLILALGTPTATTSTATAVDAETATITAVVNAQGMRTSSYIEYDTVATFAHSKKQAIFTVLRDNTYTAVTIPQDLTSLEPRTTHFARVVATNIFGTTLGNTISFVTLGTEPVLSSLTVAGITGNEATVSIDIDPGRLLSTSIIEYSTSSTFTSDVHTAQLADTSGIFPQTVSTTLASLHAQTVYYVRAGSQNRLGHAISIESSFKTIGSLPTVHLGSSTSTLSSVTLTATLNTGDTSGFVQLEISNTSSFDDLLLSLPSTFTSSGPTTHSLEVSNLEARTNYYARVRVTNDVGIVVSTPIIIRTTGAQPIFTNIKASASTRSARITGEVDTTGLSTLVVARISKEKTMIDFDEHFVYSGTSFSHSFSFEALNLLPRHNYFIQLVATNIAGETTSDITSITTKSLIGVLINDDDISTASNTVQLMMTFPVDTIAVTISNDVSFKNSRVFTARTPLDWDMLPVTSGEATRTVFVRFINSRGINSSTYSDSIIVRIQGEAPVTTIPSTPDISVPVSTTAPDKTEPPAPMVLASAQTLSTKSGVGSGVRSASFHQATLQIAPTTATLTVVQTKIGKRTTTRRVPVSVSGKIIVSFPRGQKIMYVRIINDRGIASRWTKVLNGSRR